jgi:hypothetical protein
MSMNPEDAEEEHTWSARNVRPVVALYVGGVFVGFMALAQLVFHSTDAVKALLVTAVGAVGALVPSLLTRLEYRISDAGLARRRSSEKGARGLKVLFAWEELSHLVPTRTGFKYFKKMDEPNSLLRFFKLHFSGDLSGEFHVETEDLPRVRALIDARAVPVLGSGRSARLKGRRGTRGTT